MKGTRFSLQEKAPMKKTIIIESGIEVVTHVPSPNFNPLTASAAHQVANGFPAMPEDPHHRERYAQVWGRVKNKFHYVEPTFRVEQDRTHGLRQGRSVELTQTSTNWSGGVVTPPAGQSFAWVEGEWVVPAVGAPTDGSWYYCSTFIGIDGGEAPGDVLQAGVQADVYATKSSIQVSYSPW
jgi:hypothetical protein